MPEYWYETITCDDSIGLLDAWHIVLIIAAFGTGVDQILAWAISRDNAELAHITSLADGRDIIILDRTYSHETFQQALARQQTFINQVTLKAGGPPTEIDLREPPPLSETSR